MATFLGAAVVTGIAVLLHLGRPALPWILAAFALYVVAVVVTMTVNVPLNNVIKAAGDVDSITDVGAVRQRFDEARWARWNMVRTATLILAVVFLAVALTQAA